MQRRNLVLISVVLSSSLVLGQRPQLSTSLPNRPHTTLRLMADVKSVKPGSEFTVGVLMSMEKGWHTYWKNAGEAGLPTEVSWTLPHEMTAGTIQWPIPNKYNESGEIITFGYDRENMILVQMKAPPNLRIGSTITLPADV